MTMTRTTSRKGLRWVSATGAVCVLFLLASCGRSDPAPAEQANAATHKNADATSNTGPANGQKPGQTPVSADEKKFPIAEQVGNPFDEERFRRAFGGPLPVAMSALKGTPGLQTVSYQAPRIGDAPTQVITVIVKGTTVVAIDVNMDTRGAKGKELKAELLASYVYVRSHQTTMLTPTLEEGIQVFEELEQPVTGARVLTLHHGNGSQMIFFAKDLIAAEQLLPSTGKMPPGLLEKARATLQRGMEEQKKILQEGSR